MVATTAESLLDRLDRDGYCVIEGVLNGSQVERLIQALEWERPAQSAASLERSGEVYASRNLLGEWPSIRSLARSPEILALVRSVLGPAAFPVRGLLFDKTPNANWTVPWHQDLSIAVRARVDAPGYHAWTRKAGVVHVQPPVAVLEHMITVRLHLDECGMENGPLRVVAGSHRAGRLDVAATRDWIERVGVSTCRVGCGGMVLMRPLILHASRPADVPSHRRVVHLEYAASPLPGGVEWNEPSSTESGWNS